MSNREGNNDIWIMNADGTDPRRLTTDPAADDFCSIK
jgi:Tol biopolymer transport system component